MKPKLPRGISIRASSYVAFLIHKDGTHERRVAGRVGIVTTKWAAERRVIWQREINENRY